MRIVTAATAALAVGVAAFGALTPAETGQVEAPRLLSFIGNASTGRAGQFGRWETICESAGLKTSIQAVDIDHAPVERCYLRYVDVFETRGSDGKSGGAGVIAAFVLPDKNGLRVEFGIEPGLSFDVNGFHLAREGHPVWRLGGDGCLETGICSFSGPAAAALVRAFSDRGGETLEMRLEFKDQNDHHQSRAWEMKPFAGAYEHFQANRARFAM